MKSNARFSMSDGPGVNRRCEVDRSIRRILELHIYSDRLARRQAGYGNRQVRRSGEVARGIRQRRTSGYPREENLQGPLIALLLIFLNVRVPLKVLTYPSIR